MTELNSPEQFRHKAGVRRMKKSDLKVDMTPMVDLGFLLIAFFIFTTEISEPTITDLYMPKDGDSTKIPRSKSLTVLLGNNNRIFYYYNEEEEAFKNGQIFQTFYSEINGLGNIIRRKQSELDKRKQLTIVIKPGEHSSYKNLVDALDEMLINGVTRYAITDPGKYDKRFLEQQKP